MPENSDDKKPTVRRTEVVVDALPECDFCDNPAGYDGKTKMGPRASMCEAHFKEHGIGLGLGRGQKLVVINEKDENERRRVLNDIFRQSLGLQGCGRVLMTSGVDSLPEDSKAKILLAVRDFSDFNEDNDPHDEHDFGSFEIDSHRVMWKIDYYDAEYRYHGDVNRVLTIMLAHEY